MLEEYWAQAVFCLRLTSEQFWTLTPRQFHLLFEQYRKSLAHREMLHGFTTAAVLNTAPFAREEPAAPLDFMPNHEDFGGGSAAARRAAAVAKMTPEEAAARSALQGKIFKLAAEISAGKGEMLDRIRRGEGAL